MLETHVEKSKSQLCLNSQPLHFPKEDIVSFPPYHLNSSFLCLQFAEEEDSAVTS